MCATRGTTEKGLQRAELGDPRTSFPLQSAHPLVTKHFVTAKTVVRATVV